MAKSLLKNFEEEVWLKLRYFFAVCVGELAFSSPLSKSTTEEPPEIIESWKLFEIILRYSIFLTGSL